MCLYNPSNGIIPINKLKLILNGKPRKPRKQKNKIVIRCY